jgi:hypothetical protein
LEALRYLILQLKHYKNSDDESIVIVVDRLTGHLANHTKLDEIDIDNLSLEDFSFLPCKPRTYRYGTEP